MIRAWRYVHDVEDREPIPTDHLRRAVDPAKGLLWVDGSDLTDSELDALAEQLEISPLTAEDLRHGGQRTKLEHYGDHFHVALHHCDLVDNDLVIRETDIVFGDGWLVTVRQPGDNPADPAPFDIEPAIRRFELERLQPGATDEGLLLWAIMDVVVDHYFDVADALDDRLDAIEEIVFSTGGGDNVPKEVFDLRRAMVGFRRVVAPLREVVAEILRRETECVGEVALIRMQDVYDHVLRVADLVETQRDLLTGLLEADLAVISNRMNLVMKRMTSWGAILLGSTLIAGIYGMNFTHMPELSFQYGYPMALGSMAALTLFLVWWFKRRGML